MPRPTRSLFCWVTLCIIALVSGCSSDQQAAPREDANGHAVDDSTDQVSEPATADSAGGVAGGTESSETATDAVTARIESWESTQQLVAEQSGKVVVLDLWSTACLPCIREFPKLVALQKKHPDDVVCVSFNLNYIGLAKEPPEAIRTEVLPFLEQHDARLINIISNEADEQIYARLELAAIPAVFVYDRGGKLRKRFDNEQAKTADDEFTYQKDIIPLVESLLAEEP